MDKVVDLGKTGPYFEYGGLKLLLLIAKDELSGTSCSDRYMYQIAERAGSKEYPRLAKALYRLNTRKRLDLKNPRTYNEKIQWLKLFDATPLKSRLADKYLVRDWVAERIGEEHLVPLIGVYGSFKEIDFDRLPDSFVLKCNHGCGWNAIVYDKSSEDLSKWEELFTSWLGTNYAYRTLELQYRDIVPKIVCEKLLEINIVDYRVYCFDGLPTFIKVTRHNTRSAGGYDSGLYYPDWRECEFRFVQGYGKLEMPRPECLEQVLSYAKILSRGFRFVRVDFYIVNGKIYFSEMTFSPNSGYECFEDEASAIRFGDMIRCD